MVAMDLEEVNNNKICFTGEETVLGNGLAISSERENDTHTQKALGIPA